VNFKLDLVELEHAARAEDRPGVLLHVLSLQLKDHGAPDAPFEEQARELLAAYLAMQQAGVEMPGTIDIVGAWHDGDGYEFGAAAIRNLFRPLLAKLTRERDEEREGAAAARAAMRDFEKRAHMLALERDAAAQRAERAEAALAEFTSDFEDISKAHGERVADILTLRARIAELEASREPGAEVVERLAEVAWNAHSIAIYKGRLDSTPVFYTKLDEPEKREERAYARAVLSHLAAMGEEAAIEAASDGAIAAAWYSYETPAEAADVGLGIRRVGTRMRSRLSTVIGALRAKVAELEEHTIRRVEEEREACCDVARDIYQGNTEVPRKDAPAWYACAEFIAGEIARRT
jgi:hypothetical protein